MRRNRDCTRRIVEGLAQGVAIYRPAPDGRDFLLTYLNAAAERLLCRERAELLGRPLSQVLPGAAEVGLPDLLRQVQASGEPAEIPARRYRDGHLDFWVASRVFPLDTGELVAVLEDHSPRIAQDQAQEAIRSRYRSVFENSLIGIFTVDRERIVMEINRRACEIFRLAPEDAIGHSVERLHCSREHYLRFGEQVFQRIGQDGVLNIRYPLRRADGAVFPAELSGKPLNGRNLEDGVVWVIADLSQSQAVEAALRESEERFAVAVAGANDGLWDWKIPENRVYFSPRWKEMLGYGDAELPDRFSEWRNRVHPDDLPGALAAIDDHLKGTTDHLHIEFRMRHKDGSWRWILARATCVRDDAGQPMRMAGSHTDVTDRKRYEDQILENERRLQAVFTAVQTGIAIIDLQTRRIVDANDMAADILRVPRGDLIGAPCFEHFCAEPQACPFMGGRDRACNEEVRFRRADGQPITVLKSVVALDLSGRRILVESFVDISRRIRTEQELRAAKEQAEQAALAKSEFLAKMSHEIRTPMSSIIGMTKLTLDSELDAEQRENLEIVDASADALLSLIDDILDFSKIEAGQVELESVDFALAPVIEDVMEGFGYRAAQKGIELVHLIDIGVPPGLCGDPTGLRQILVNLIGNALKFTDAGEILLEVGVEAGDPTGTTLRFTVSDTGVGVPEAKREAIFEAFTQADNSTRRRFGGTGLGLSISRQLVRLMGGDIGVEGRPGGGSRFWFTARFGVAQVPVPASEDPTAGLAGARCLIVDDNRANRLVLEKTLDTWDCRVGSATGGQEALGELRRAAADATPYDLVLLDMMMPGLDGEETARLIQADPGMGRPQVIVLTSVGHRGDAQRLAGAGVVGCLLKPIRRALLFETMSRALGRGACGAAATATRGARSRAASGGAADRSLVGMRVLLVEDKPFNQRLAVRLLERRGVLVTTAEDGGQALEAVASAPFDLILMDVQMPVMDGFDATRLIRERELAAQSEGSDRPADARPRRMPIVAMTAHALKGDRERCLAAGMDDYLTKPIDAERLYEKLGAWCPRSVPAQAAPAARSAVGGAPAAAVPADPVPERLTEALARLRVAVGDDPAQWKELIALFAEDAERDLAALESAVTARDGAGSAALAHSLKGMTRNLGLDDLGDLFKCIEDLGADGRPAAARAPLVQAGHRTRGAIAELRRYLAGEMP